MRCGCGLPWTRVMPYGWPLRSLVAKLPSVQTTAAGSAPPGRTGAPRRRRSRPAAGRGCPAAGTSARSRCRPGRGKARSRPAATQQLPGLADERDPAGPRGSPGASPTNIRSASGSPAPTTTWVRPRPARTSGSPAIRLPGAPARPGVRRRHSSTIIVARRRGTRSAAAAGAAAATAAADRRALRAGGRKRRQEPRHRIAAAVGAAHGVAAR